MPHLIVIRSIPPYAEKGNIFVFLPGREGWAKNGTTSGAHEDYEHFSATSDRAGGCPKFFAGVSIRNEKKRDRSHRAGYPWSWY